MYGPTQDPIASPRALRGPVGKLERLIQGLSANEDRQWLRRLPSGRVVAKQSTSLARETSCLRLITTVTTI